MVRLRRRGDDDGESSGVFDLSNIAAPRGDKADGGGDVGAGGFPSDVGGGVDARSATTAAGAAGADAAASVAVVGSSLSVNERAVASGEGDSDTADAAEVCDDARWSLAGDVSTLDFFFLDDDDDARSSPPSADAASGEPPIKLRTMAAADCRLFLRVMLLRNDGDGDCPGAASLSDESRELPRSECDSPVLAFDSRLASVPW